MSRRSASASLSFEPLESRLAMTVVVTEFLAENDSGIRDFSGERHDWIELQNTGPAAVDVSGWYLTDDASNLTKWQIPATPATTSLAPGAFLLVFASDKNGVYTGELHANFKLARSGEDLALVEADGTTIASAYLSFPEQYADVSYGLGADRSATVSEAIIADQANATVRPYDGPNPAVDDHWRKVDYDDSAWIQTKTGVGYDRDSSPNNLLDSLIFQELTSGQMNFNGSTGQIAAYVRVPFTVADKEQMTSLVLELRYDDGYILYLNDREVQRANVHTSLQPGDTVELNARTNRPDATVVSTPDVIDLTAWLDRIHNGDNVLAIYGANHTASSERNDFLIHPLLNAQRATGAAANTYMTSPTPGRDNGAGWLGLVADTQFSVKRGFYSSPQSVAITTDTPGATIRYTIDGSAPTATTGTVYAGPIAITTTTTLRAAAFKPGYLPTDVDTQTYLFLDDVLAQSGVGLPDFASWGNPPDWSMDPAIVAAVGAEQLKSDLTAIPTVSLVMNWQDLFGDGTNHGIYTENAAWKNKSDPRATSIEFIMADGSEHFHADAAIEIQGHSSVTRWNTDKLSFQVKFKAPYGVGELDAPLLFANSAVPGHKQADSFDGFILDAHYNYTWLHANVQQRGVAKYVNDQVVADLQNLAGGYAPHGRWVHLYLNGMYWGIYNLHERPDDSFAQEYFGGSEDDYYAVKAADGVSGHPAEYAWVDGGFAAEAAYATLLSLVDGDVSNHSAFQQVEAVLDVDDFINYMIVHYYAGNWDWGQDNWYATYNHVDPAGRWRFHAWDQEHAWPTDDNLALGESNFRVNYDSTAKNDAYGPTGIHRKLMGSPEYKLRFADRVQELMHNGGLLTPAAAAAVFQLRVAELDRAINGEAARWGDNRVASAYDRADWLANVNGVLADFFPVRTGIVIGQFNSRGWLASLAAPTFSQYGGQFVGSLALSLGNPNVGGTIYYTLDGSDPRLVGGGISPTAIAYTGSPLQLDSSTQVRARVRNGSSWSAAVDKTFLEEASFPLRIVELHYNPAGPSETTEFIELLNIGATTISLDGVTIGGFATNPYEFQAGQTLAAGERIVVARNPSDFVAAYGAGIRLATGPGYAEANLSNGGELVTLSGPLGELLQSFTYSDAAPWPTAADGDGPSLEYVGPLYAGENPADGAPHDPFDDPANWRASLVIGGTPGTDGNPVAPNADFNGDDRVDGGDFLAWQRGFGATNATANDGDADGNKLVDAADLTIWREQFGRDSASVSLVVGAGALPESGDDAARSYWLELPTSVESRPERTAAPLRRPVQAVSHIAPRELAFAKLHDDAEQTACTRPGAWRSRFAAAKLANDLASAALDEADERIL
ncbi:MAG: CotH kinase family protein [Pirellulales bacterium]|nr:CotH kinase family protein [Pirellulales bacterium]